MAEYKDEEYMAAIRRSGATPEMLERMLGKFAVLMTVEEKRAELAVLDAKRAAIVDENARSFAEAVSPLDAEREKLRAQLAELEAQAAMVIAPAAPG